jgi:signal transduction histidine kinase
MISAFKNLRTGTKLIILCCTFIVAIGVTIYSLVVEKHIAIDFARKELVGNRYLAALRETYAAVLIAGINNPAGAHPTKPADEILNALSAAGADADRTLGTGEFQRALAAKRRALWSGEVEGGRTYTLVLDVLASARNLASRIGDESNLALDPELDSYYLQDIVVTKLPAFLGQVAEIRGLFHGTSATGVDANERIVRFQVMEGLLRSLVDGTRRSLAAAYRGNSDGSLRQSIDGKFAAMISRTEAYLMALSARLAGGEAKGADTISVDRLYLTTVEDAIAAWAAAQAALDRLLRQRIDGLHRRMAFSLGLTGALAGLSILIALMTHRHIVLPLERLEHTASTVRETKDYDLRIAYSSQDEIGRLAGAFNDMLSELAAARERELAKQAELARVTRLTTMGQMAASLAHEVNQPLTAIVTGSNAGLRWLARTTPDLDEVRAVLERIARDGHRASQVIASVRAMFKKGVQKRTAIDINDLVREVLALVYGDLQSRSISVHTELARQLPPVLADHVQLQQVVLNLITNAADAMQSVRDRARLLRVKSATHEPDGILIVVADAGTGIDWENSERIFDPFFTTKSNGMGLGLSICRSIVEAHGGRLWASPGTPHGSVFHVALPSGNPGGAS